MRLYYFNEMGYLFIPFLIVIFISTQLFAESHNETYSKIMERKQLIFTASKLFDINPQYLATVIYTERTKNYDWTDEAFDEIIAKTGQNSSMGFSQVKIKTAYFIEKQITDSVSAFFCGKKYEHILMLSKSPFKLIQKLKTDSLNILYAAAYLRIIQTFWSNKGYPIDNKPDIIGSLYQLGLFHSDGKVREPHFNPKANEFGEKVKESLIIFNNFGSNSNKIFMLE